MDIPASTVELILRKAIEKSGKTYDRFGLSELPAIINSELPSQYKKVGDRYLYDTVYLSIEKALKSKQEHIRLNRSCLDSIVNYIGFKNIEEFRFSQIAAIRDEMVPLEGAWYSIVRSSSGLPYILLSPVQIRISDNHKAILKLKGPHRIYQGEIKWIGGSISTLITSEDKTKNLHLAFKVGVSKYPKVLMGVFSGVSTAGEPIAGKEILYKSKVPFEAMENAKIRIEPTTMRKETIIPNSIINYLTDFDNCYFKITGTGTFDLEDL